MVSTAFTRLLKPLLLPLASGDHYIDPPVVLAPMAGITNAPFRTLCREQGAGLFVSEMVTARALIERRPETLRMIVPGKDEWPRSVQLYSVDPTTMRAAVTMLGKENLADHIDMNFGCPVPKVTRKGGGAALPFKRKLFTSIVGAAVEAAKPFGIPVTVKMRIGIDSDHETYLEAAQSAADLGDIVSVTGEIITSKRGELSILANSWKLASKSLRPLPNDHKPMSEETRVRMRYVDLIVRPEARSNARLRPQVMRSLRETFHNQNFIEVKW